MTRIGLGAYLILQLCKAIHGMILVFLHALQYEGPRGLGLAVLKGAKPAQ